MAKSTFSENARRVAVAVATNELCKSEYLGSLSTDDICRKAGVSKTSFYRIFHGKYDILDWCQSFPIEQGVSKMGRSLTCHEGISTTFEGLALFRDLFRTAPTLTGVKPLSEVGRETISSHLLDTLAECHGKTITDELAFKIDWITDASSRAAKRWLEEEGDKTPDEMADLIEACYPPDIRKLLNAPTEPGERSPLSLNSLMLSAVEQ